MPWLEILTLVYKMIFLLLLQIATTRNYNLAREYNCNPCESNVLTDTDTKTSKKTE